MPAERFVGEPGRLDTILTRLAGLTRADVQRAIASGRVTVDGVIRHKSFALAGGETFEMQIEAEGPLQPEGPPVPIRFEDAYLLVIAKPPGLVTHPTERRRSGTLVNRLLGMGVPLSSAGGPLRPGIVHRLDAGTSGLMLVAKTDETHEALVGDVPTACRRAALPRARSRTGGARHVRGGRGARPARGEGDPGRDGGTAGGDALRGPGANRVRHLAGGGAPDRAHASDPGAPVVDRSSDPGRPCVRRRRRRRAPARAHSAVPALVAHRVRPSGDGRAHRARGAASGRPGVGARRAGSVSGSEMGRRDLQP